MSPISRRAFGVKGGNNMGYKLKSDISAYIDTITPQELKEAFEEYGFEVELKDEFKEETKREEKECGEEYEKLRESI
jgi:hypothetical protein